MTHHTHPDPAVRDLIAQAEARGAERERERINGRVAGLARSLDAWDWSVQSWPADVTIEEEASAYDLGLSASAAAIRALLDELRDEAPR